MSESGWRFAGIYLSALFDFPDDAGDGLFTPEVMESAVKFNVFLSAMFARLLAIVAGRELYVTQDTLSGNVASRSCNGALALPGSV